MSVAKPRAATAMGALPAWRTETLARRPALPAGRRVEEAVRGAAGYRVFPALLPSMVGLTLRGAALWLRLDAAGVPALEVFRGMAQDRLGLPRKQADLAGLERGLRRIGVRGLPRARRITHDELAAVTCAMVGLLHRAGATETFGPGVPAPFAAPRAELGSK